MRKNSSLILWSALGVVVLLVLAGLIGFPLWMGQFIRGQAFRQLVAAQTGNALQAEATYSPLKWQGASAFSNAVKVEGGPSSFVKSLQADQVRAEVNWRAIWDGAWRIERVEIVNFEGVFGPRDESAAVRAEQEPPTRLPDFLPQRFELGELKIAQAKLVFQGGSDGLPIVVADTRLDLHPDGAGWKIDGSGGTLTLPKLPEWDIIKFRSRLQEGVFFLTGANLRLGANGKVSTSGEFSKSSKQSSKLRVQWTHLDVATFLDEEWRARLSGRFDGSADLTWPEAGPAAGTATGTATGTFRVSEGLLQDLPLLDKIATFTRARQFRHMPIQELSGHFDWLGGDLLLRKLVLESKGLMRIEGQCEIGADGSLAGTLRVGVTPQTLQWLPGSRERVFTVAENGYLWTPLQVGGTLKNPKEDLSSRLAAAMKDEVIDQGRKVLEVLPGPAGEGAKGIYDALSPLLR